MPKKCENCKRLARELRDYKDANQYQLETIRILAERVRPAAPPLGPPFDVNVFKVKKEEE